MNVRNGMSRISTAPERFPLEATGNGKRTLTFDILFLETLILMVNYSSDYL